MYLRKHGVLPSSVPCNKCGQPYTYLEERHRWQCGRTVAMPRSKKRRQCVFSTSDFKGTFVEQTHLPVWKILKTWDHQTVIECLSMSSRTSTDWRSFCSEVTMSWMETQQSIGGPGVIVEIDETLLVRRKYESGRLVRKEAWCFGGIERVSKIVLSSSHSTRTSNANGPMQALW